MRNNLLIRELLTLMRSKALLKDYISGSITATSGGLPLHGLYFGRNYYDNALQRTFLVTVRCISSRFSNYRFRLEARLYLPASFGLFRSSDTPTCFSIQEDSGVLGSANREHTRVSFIHILKTMEFSVDCHVEMFSVRKTWGTEMKCKLSSIRFWTLVAYLIQFPQSLKYALIQLEKEE